MTQGGGGRTVLLVCGLNREAALAVNRGVTTVVGGGSRTALEARLSALDGSDASAVLSFGLAGALDRTVEVAGIIVPDRIYDPGSGVTTTADPALMARMRTALARAGLDARGGSMVGSDTPFLSAAVKAAQHATTGAVAVDMESHVAGAYAVRRGLPFAAIRVISDDADRTLPPVAAQAMRPDGSVDVGVVLAGLVRGPGQIPALIATARDAAAAFRVLRRVGRLLLTGGGLLGLDL